MDNAELAATSELAAYVTARRRARAAAWWCLAGQVGAGVLLLAVIALLASQGAI